MTLVSASSPVRRVRTGQEKLTPSTVKDAIAWCTGPSHEEQCTQQGFRA